MAYYAGWIVLAFGIIGLIMGYRSNKRNTMVAGAVLIYLSGTAGEPLVDFARGLHNGFYGVNLTEGQAVRKG